MQGFVMVKEALKGAHAVKPLLTVFFDYYEEFTPAGQMVDADYYLGVLNCSKARIVLAGREYQNQGRWCLLHDNERQTQVQMRFLISKMYRGA